MLLAILLLASSAGAAIVTVSGRQILVDGIPFTIKGAGYAPTPIGTDPETTSPYGDYFTSSYASIYDRDIPLLRKMGANTVRLWGWNNIADHTDFLNKAYNNGTDPIYVIVSFWMGPSVYPDISSPDARAQIKANFRNMVKAHKTNPAVLMYAIGNELNTPWMYGDKPSDLFSLINEMAQDAHIEEGVNYHPVTTPLADINLVNTIATYDSTMTNLDVWSVQLYRGSSFGSFFSDYAIVSRKPLAVLEYGIDAYDNRNGDEYEKIGTPYQATYAQSLWKEIVGSSNISSGGSIMAYSDEWWKGKHGHSYPGCPDYDPSLHSNCGYPAGSHPDGYSNEEWWGIMRTKDNGSNPDIMEPRTAYYTLQSLWAVTNNPPNTPTSLTQYKSDGVNGIPFGGVTGEITVVMKGNVSDPDGNNVQLEVEVRPVGTSFSNTPTCGSGSAVASGNTASVTCSGLASGQYHWQARAKDSHDATGSWFNAGGNPETNPDFIVDTIAPPSPTPDDGISGWSSDNTLTFSWTAPTDTSGIAGYYYKVDSGSETWTTLTTVTLPAQSDGTHTFYVKAKDNAGNIGTYGSHSFSIDTTLPTISITSPTDGQIFTTSIIIVSGTASDDIGLSKAEVKVGTGSWQIASGTASWITSVTLTSGSNTIYAKATDTAGNTQETSVTITYSPSGGGELRGDVNRNGIRDTGDATIILRYIVDLSIPSEYIPILPIGDMNCNGMIDTGDATLVLRDVVSLTIDRCWE